MLLGKLGFNEHFADDDGVAILVGPNGAGKSRALRAIAEEYRSRRETVVVSNAAHDRFRGMPVAKRLSFGRGGDSAKSIIKRALSAIVSAEDSSLFQVRAVLQHCGYNDRIGFRPNLNFGDWVHDGPIPTPRPLPTTTEVTADYERAVFFLRRYREPEIEWLETGSTGRELAIRDDLAALLRSEPLLRRTGLIRNVEVYLEKHRQPLVLDDASSGELSLISSLIFLIGLVPRNGIVLIDEPENSLHPGWQRQYVEKVLEALLYKNVSLIIATHSPLIVTGSMARHGPITSVYRVVGPAFERLKLQSDPTSPNGIEEVLWKAFEVVTPANHFVSEEIVAAINEFERDRLSMGDVLELVGRMDGKSEDPTQKAFFDAIRQLIEKIALGKGQASLDVDGDNDD